MKWQREIREDCVILQPEAPGLLDRLRGKTTDLTAPDPGDHALSLALGDLAAIEEEHSGDVQIEADRIVLSHQAVSRIDGNSAQAIGLPPFPDLTLSTDVQGIVGSDGFRLNCRWLRDGRPEPVRRTGAILHTRSSDAFGGDRRIPHTLLEAIELAEAPPASDMVEQWNVLARFRQALLGADADEVGRIAMTDFLSGLDVHLASGFSMEPRDTRAGLDFEVRAHEGQGPDAALVPSRQDMISAQIRQRGALPAYRLASGSYLVVDPSAKPVLDVMAQMQKAPPSERDAFVRDPWPRIWEAVEQDLTERGVLEDLGDADYQNVVETAAASFVEVPGYAERVTGVGDYEKPDIDFGPGSGVIWLPEIFGSALAERIDAMDSSQLADLRDRIKEAVDADKTEFQIGSETVPIDTSAVAALDAEIERRKELDGAAQAPADADADKGGVQDLDASKPQILQTGENLDDISYLAKFAPRSASSTDAMPTSLLADLHPHQIDGLSWARNAWRSGLPGILNADEQGLGKTLQTIAFLAWLKEQLAVGDGPCKGPVLVVAPTSLLETWEKEVETHLEAPGLGTLIRLYGSKLSAFKRSDARGRETEDASEKLDFSLIHEALEDGRAHRMWMLTTYQTLTNFQHSIGRIPFSTIVFDEIQALKNPGTLAAKAAKAMNGDFRIGLTGTPVENTVSDLWAILDQLVPGYLGSLKEFRKTYDSAEHSSDVLTALHAKVFEGHEGKPPVGLRRLKEQAAAHLPEKTRLLHPSVMPNRQAEAYESARVALANGGPGAALKMLHRIRGVSLHPDPAMSDGFEDASARLSAALEVLDRIARQHERALVFIEDRKIQHRFKALARARYGLETIDVINGSTPISQRQAIVDRFQSLMHSGQFGLLILGPRAAGTGLTLTAATHVVHLSRWWNPAVEEQCNDRVHRIGQKNPVSVHIPMAIHPRYGLGSFDCQLQLLMEKKRKLARETLFPAGETSKDADVLKAAIAGDGRSDVRSIDQLMEVLFAEMGKDLRKTGDGAYHV